MGNIEDPTSNSEHRKKRPTICRTNTLNSSWFKAGIICEPNNHPALRYLLIKPGNNPIAIIGLNPSTANCSKPDPTMESVGRLMARFQSSGPRYDGFLMVNLYPERFSKPRNLPPSANRDIAEENLRQVTQAFQKYNVQTVWAAWGNNIVCRSYLKISLEYLVEQAIDVQWKHCEDLTKSGHPRHPLYIKTGKQLVNFDISTYLRRLA